jgi:hypothetical protein
MRALAVPTAIGHLVPPPEHLSVALPRDADACFELFCDVRRIPEWLGVVRSATIVQHDTGGRPTEVAYLARLEQATIGYTCGYRYGRRRVAWQTTHDGAIRVEGYAQFQPLNTRACLLTYALDVDLGNLPGWADPTYTSHLASASLGDFRDFVTRVL